MRAKFSACWLLGALLWQPHAWGAPPPFLLLTDYYPPLSMMVANNQVGGLTTELAQALFQRAKIPAHIKLWPWAAALAVAAKANNTCVYPTTRTPKRETLYKWVGPLTADPWVLYAGPLSPKIKITRLEDVAPYRIGSYSSSAEGQYLSTHHLTLVMESDDEANPRMLAGGRIDFWATSIYRAPYEIQKGKFHGFYPVLMFKTDNYTYLACNTTVADSTITHLNQLLQRMRQDGAIDKIRARYALRVVH